MRLPGGGVVQAYGLSGFISTSGHETPSWGLYLDVRWEERRQLSWPHRFVRWPDYELPDDELDAFEAFDEAWQHVRAGSLIDIACDGGIGRTGTALACIALRDGVPRSDVVPWVRHHYHPYAVEVPEQEHLIDRFLTWVSRRDE